MPAPIYAFPKLFKEMTSPADEFVAKAVEMREAGRIEESLIAARHATKVDPEEANAWWQLALAVLAKDGQGAAVPHLKKTVELAPGFAYGWYRLGFAFKKSGMTDEAVEAWERAIEEDPIRVDALKALADAYGEREYGGDADKLIEVLKTLELLDELTSIGQHQLGVAYYKNKDYHNAIKMFSKFAGPEQDHTAYFNMALCFESETMGQDADAVDAYRMALSIKDDYERAQKNLDSLLPRTQRLRQLALSAGNGLLPQDQWYAHYINPFELLNLTDIGNPFDLDAKDIQRAKKLLLQEIDVEDGKVEWVPGLTIDRSRAIKVVDEMTDTLVRYNHHLVFQCKPLRDFLSRGDIGHFVVDPDDSPLEFINELHTDEDILKLISSPFAAQFDLVFTKALEKRSSDVIECMLDGRRWVAPQDEDRCFEGAHRQIDRLLEPLRNASNLSEKSKPRVASINSILNQGDMGKIIGLLPMLFQQAQNEGASLIRSISIDTYNHHDDPDVAKEILLISRQFAKRSPSLQLKIKEDIETLDEKIKEAKKDEASITLRGESFSITREYVSFGKGKLKVGDVKTIRWGTVRSRTGTVETLTMTMIIGDWSTNLPEFNTTVHSNFEETKKLFGTLVDALFAYVMPHVMSAVRKQISDNQTTRYGAVVADSYGIKFTIPGWFGEKQEHCPWRRLRSEIDNGEVVITDSANPKAKVSLPLPNVDNAFILHMIIKNQQN